MLNQTIYFNKKRALFLIVFPFFFLFKLFEIFFFIPTLYNNSKYNKQNNIKHNKFEKCNIFFFLYFSISIIIFFSNISKVELQYFKNTINTF